MLFRRQGRFEVHVLNDDTGRSLSRFQADVTLQHGFEERASAGCCEPQSEQVTFAVFFRPVLVLGASVNDDMIMQELDIAGSEIGFVFQLVCEDIHHFQRFCLGRGEPGECLETLGRTDIVIVPAARKISFREAKHGQFEPGVFAGRNFVPAVAVPRLDQFGDEIGPTAEHFIIDRDRACNRAHSAGSGRLQAEQSDDVAGIRMVVEIGARMIGAGGGTVAGRTCKVINVTEQMAVMIL